MSHDGGKYIDLVSPPSTPIWGWVPKPPNMSKSTLYYPNYMCRITSHNSELFRSYGWKHSYDTPLHSYGSQPSPELTLTACKNVYLRKDFLLWEEGVSTWAQRETVAYVICHEIVHQWLGNLVTTTWWNTTWLNEGVTSFYHYYFVDKVGLASSPRSFRTILVAMM